MLMQEFHMYLLDIKSSPNLMASMTIERCLPSGCICWQKQLGSSKPHYSPAGCPWRLSNQSRPSPGTAGRPCGCNSLWTGGPCPQGEHHTLKELLFGQQLALRTPGSLSARWNTPWEGPSCRRRRDACPCPSHGRLGQEDGEVEAYGVGVEDGDGLEAPLPQSDDNVLGVVVGEHADLQVAVVIYKLSRINKLKPIIEKS